MINKLEELLKDKIPKFLQGNKNLDEFLEAAGAYLDEFRVQIETISKLNDYANVPDTLLNQLGASLDMEFPANMDVSAKRTIVRDLIEIYRKNGTEKTIEWLFKIIGLRVTFRYAWVLNPSHFRNGKKVFYTSGTTFTEEDVDLNNISYRDFVYGEEQVDSDGVFFYGQDFFDLPEDGNKYEKYVIEGQTYNTALLGLSKNTVSKTPYMVAQINEEDYRIFTQPYTVIENGVEVEYSYTSSETFQIASDVVDYFLKRRGRPADVRIIFLTIGLDEDDALEEMSDTFTLTTEAFQVAALIGDQMYIGSSTPYNNRTEYHQQLIGSDYMINVTNAPLTPFSHFYEEGFSGDVTGILMTGTTTISFTLPPGVTATGRKKAVKGEIGGVIVPITTGGYNELVFVDGHEFVLNIGVALPSRLEIQIQITP